LVKTQRSAGLHARGSLGVLLHCSPITFYRSTTYNAGVEKHLNVVLVPVLQGREVQQRLVQQRQKAAARAVNAKASRNVSKSKGKKARKTAAAMADW
jgi:hypothetical protein